MKNYYKNKRVLITGADGFIGSHLTERLLGMGAKVSIFVRGTSVNGTGQYRLKHLTPYIDKFEKIITGNIANPESVDLVASLTPAVIFHLAAEAYVPKCFEQPLDVFKTNLDGTLNILEAARNIKGIERVVITSSSEVYGSYDHDISEKDLLNPTSPYGASKAAADRAAYSWFVTYHLPIAIIRPFNTYGPRHTYDVIPKFIRLALAGKPLTVHGTGKQSRDFIYVSDTVEGFLIMGWNEKAVGEVVNFGAGHGVSITEIAENIVELSGSPSEIIYDKARLAEVERLTSDPSKAAKLFGWSPKIGIKEGLAKNILWAKENL